MTQSGHRFVEWRLSSAKLQHKAPTKCEIAHTPLKRNSFKLIVRAPAKGTANGKRKRALARVLDIIDDDTRAIC
jgi:hypothetical protein